MSKITAAFPSMCVDILLGNSNDFVRILVDQFSGREHVPGEFSFDLSCLFFWMGREERNLEKCWIIFRRIDITRFGGMKIFLDAIFWAL